jgi:hypothetical protein
MRKERSIEEVRAKERERQARWRLKNKVLSRERKAYVYGKAKYPEMVEERMRLETRERYGVSGRPPVIDHVTTPPKTVIAAPVEEEEFIEQELTYDPNPDDGRTDVERKQHEQQQAWRAKRRGGSVSAPEVKDPGVKPRGDAAGRRKEFAALKEALQPKKVVTAKGGRGVEIKLEVE